MEKSKKENISIGKISELLKNAPTDDGTFCQRNHSAGK